MNIFNVFQLQLWTVSYKINQSFEDLPQSQVLYLKVVVLNLIFPHSHYSV